MTRPTSRFGVRARTTVAATVVVGLVLAGSGVLLVLATSSALRDSVETTVTARAVDVASQLNSTGIPQPVPLIRSISVQIVQEGVVLSSTGDIEGQSPIVDPVSVNAPQAVPNLDDNEGESQDDSNDSDGGPYFVAVERTTVDRGELAVIAAGSLASVNDATRTLIPFLSVGVPMITLLAGLLVWRLTKRAFLPVDLMAQRASSITFTDLHLRIPEPTPNDEIRRLAVVLNGMLDRLETAVTRQRTFTADAGHELKSPVATLLTMAEVAAANPQAFSVEELASDVEGQSRRLAALVEDLLALARIDEGRLELNIDSFDLGAAARAELAVGSPDTIALVDSVQPVIIQGDARRVGQVIRNLLDNAIRHAATTVRVETHATDGGGTIVIADDGPGIPEADREKIFERFVRLDEARSREHGGTGLGLSVSRSIVEAHGGTITVDDDPQLGGGRVTVRLPTTA